MEFANGVDDKIRRNKYQIGKLNFFAFLFGAKLKGWPVGRQPIGVFFASSASIRFQAKIANWHVTDVRECSPGMDRLIKQICEQVSL